MRCIRLRVFFLSFLILPYSAVQASENPSIPTFLYSNGQQELVAPDWSKITWENLPPIQEPGSIQIPKDLATKIGYNPSRFWQAGTRPDSFVMLGDVRDVFHLQAFNLEDVANLSGLAMKNLNLNDFELMRWQTPNSLVRAIPRLGKLPVNQVAPIRDLLKPEVGNISIDQAIRQNPTLANTTLGKLDLQHYKLQSIPGLIEAPIGKFASWQQSLISQVPGLSRVPFSKFPTPLAGGIGVVAIADVVWSDAEGGDPEVDTQNFISGSINRKNATVPATCEAAKPCAYMELSDPVEKNGSLKGKRWSSGITQKVKGGFGPLAKVNSGWEPTGRLVYGSAFKVVLAQVDESKGVANFSLYLRACARIPFYGKSCTPYFIGPIPWIPVKEKGAVIVSAIQSPSIKIPSKYQERIRQIEQQYEPKDNNTTNTPASPNTPINESNTGRANARIIEAVNRLGGFSSNVPGTDGGRNACMWAVNHVLKESGFEPLANDTLAVRTGQAALENGRGQKINIADAQPGDIVLVDAGGSHQHIGFCTNKGCTETISNSSSQASFSFRGNSNFSYKGSPYNGAAAQVYRLRK